MISTVYSTTMRLYDNLLCLSEKDASWLEFFKQLFSFNNETFVKCVLLCLTSDIVKLHVKECTYNEMLFHLQITNSVAYSYG